MKHILLLCNGLKVPSSSRPIQSMFMAISDQIVERWPKLLCCLFINCPDPEIRLARGRPTGPLSSLDQWVVVVVKLNPFFPSFLLICWLSWIHLVLQIDWIGALNTNGQRNNLVLTKRSRFPVRFNVQYVKYPIRSRSWGGHLCN